MKLEMSTAQASTLQAIIKARPLHLVALDFLGSLQKG